ncbi:MAG: YcaO-like family protein [Reyranellaceae bacterium]
MPELSEIFLAAATALEQPTAPAVGVEVAELLAWLDCPPRDPPDDTARHRARLLRAAAQFRRFFRLTASSAPGFACFGGEADPAALGALQGLPVVGVAGGGATPLEAFERCVGEGIERMSCMEIADDLSITRRPPPVAEAWLAQFPGMAESQDWLPARRVTGEAAEVLLPVDLCRWRSLARRQASLPFAASLGCAAGPTMADAMFSGLCEVVERDAAALWWRGGRRGRPLPLEAAATAAEQLKQFRHQAERLRRSWLIDITTDLAIPAVAAISCDADGGAVAIGTAARPNLALAAEAATRDLVLNELAVELVDAKLAARGEAALNEEDHAHLKRSRGLHVARHPILHPHGAPPTQPRDDQPTSGLAGMLDRIAKAGWSVYAVDLTRLHFDVPVVRMLCPGLESVPSQVVGTRLRSALDAPDAERGHGEIALF